MIFIGFDLKSLNIDLKNKNNLGHYSNYWFAS